MINETATPNHWVLLRLTGTKSNRSAIGAVVRVAVGGRTRVDEVRAGRGYQSAEDLVPCCSKIPVELKNYGLMLIA